MKQELFNLVFIENEMFSARQNQIINCLLNGKTSYKQISRELRISVKAVGNSFYGTENGSKKLREGIFGIVEDKFGKRPMGGADLIWMLGNNGIIKQVKVENSGLTHRV